ncbi:MAG: hypothetical protein CENE_00417 [Candidatus Celerinatantimonas neptuna]|nr:MAG: hypothetical protein CENE_00417 [Candidatus Celerinatantimonas neptuna]
MLQASQIGSVFGINKNFKDRATIRNLKIKNYKKEKPKVCVMYKGVQLGHESPKIGERWNNSNCNISHSDIKKL